MTGVVVAVLGLADENPASAPILFTTVFSCGFKDFLAKQLKGNCLDKTAQLDLNKAAIGIVYRFAPIQKEFLRIHDWTTA